MAMQKVDVEFNADGTATVTLPGGKTKQVSSSKVAELTLQIAEAIGTVTERHAAHSHIKLEGGGEKIVWHEKQEG